MAEGGNGERMDGLRALVWSDYICPFCFVGLERAQWLEREHGATVDWLPFDLHPEYPPEGIPRAQLEERYGPEIHERTRQAVEAAGLEYGPPDRIPRSLKALALAELARDRDRHAELHERVMRAYWSEGRDIGDDDVLVELAAATGLDADEARAALTDEGYAARVAGSTRAAQEHGVNAVPAFVLDDRLLVLGAHPHEVFDAAERDAVGHGCGSLARAAR